MIRQSLSIAVALICAAPLATLADGPATRPVNRPGIDRGPDRGVDRGTDRNSTDRPPTDRSDRPRMFRQGGGGGGGAARTPISSEQWSQILSFMREHSPRRTEELEMLIDAADDKKVNFLKSLVAAQFDYVMSLKSEDTKLYELQIDKIAAQDAIYGMLRDAKGTGMQPDQKKEFREQVAKLVDVNLSERGRRIDKARESLTKAKSTLDDDLKRKDAMVDERMEQFLKEGARPLKLDAPPGNSPAGSRSPGDQGARAEEYRRAEVAAVDQQLDALLLASLIR